MSNYPIWMPEEPKGIGSIIRVVFKYLRACDAETFYVGVAPGRWAGYGGDGVGEFTWREMLEIIKFDEAEIFEVAYEGFGVAEREDKAQQHIKDWIWREAL